MVAKVTVVSDKEIAEAARKFFRLLAMASPTVAKVAKEAAEEAIEEADDEPEVNTDDLPALDQEETEALSIKELRVLAKKYGVDSIKKAEILDGLSEFFEGEDDDENADEDDDDDDDEEAGEDADSEYDRDELEELSLKELRTTAKEAGHAAAEYRGMDQDALVDLILGELADDEDEDDEEADEDEDDDDDAEEEIDEDALNAMTLVELRSLAKEVGVKVKVPVTAKTDLKKKKVYVAAILESADE